MDDLFGHVPQQQHSLFPPEPAAPAKPRDYYGTPKRPPYTVDDIREKMHALLARARAAERMPWKPRHLRSYTAMFPYMAEWLKDGEGEQLLLEFKAEMDRLGAPANQVAPNWRELWGLAA